MGAWGGTHLVNMPCEYARPCGEDPGVCIRGVNRLRPIVLQSRIGATPFQWARSAPKKNYSTKQRVHQNSHFVTEYVGTTLGRGGDCGLGGGGGRIKLRKIAGQ